MKPLAAVLLLLGLAPVGTGAPRTLDRASGPLVKELVAGPWKGQAGCAGDLAFGADGTYAWTGYGPGAADSGGTWQLRDDAVPAALVLTCKTSLDPDEVGSRIEFVLTRAGGELVIERAGKPAVRYARPKK